MNLFGSCASCVHVDSLRSKLINLEGGMGDSCFSVSGKATWDPEAAAMIGAPAIRYFYFLRLAQKYWALHEQFASATCSYCIS